MGEAQQNQTDEELLAELKRVGSDLGFRMQIRKYLKWIGLFLLFNLAISIIAITAFTQMRTFQGKLCENNNEFRRAYVNQWAPILAESPEPVKPPLGSPQEAVDAYNSQVKTRKLFKDSLDTDFAQQPC